MNVVIVDYGSGNLRSAAKAFERAAADTATAVVVSSDPKALKAASHIVLPGQGAFADCKRGLEGVAGMTEALEEAVTIGYAVLVGFHANDWRRRSLGRKDFEDAGIVAAPRADAALRRFGDLRSMEGGAYGPLVRPDGGP